MRKFLLVVVAYLFGSTSFGFLITKVLTGDDLRKTGSSSTGATNVYRKLGPFWAIFVGFCDVMKAFIPTRIAVKFWPNQHWFHLLVGAAAVIGHTWPVFLRSGGGKAVTPSVGVSFAIISREPKLWKVFQFALGGALGMIIASRGIIYRGSVFGPFLGALYSIRLSNLSKLSRWYTLGICLIAAFITYTHRENFSRDFKGEEPQTGRKFFQDLINIVGRLLK